MLLDSEYKMNTFTVFKEIEHLKYEQITRDYLKYSDRC